MDTAFQKAKARAEAFKAGKLQNQINPPVASEGEQLETDGVYVNRFRAYKGFDKGFICRGYQFDRKKWHSVDGTIKVCSNGFHACINPKDVNTYYSFTNPNHVYALVQLAGQSDIKSQRDKVAAEKLRILKIFNSPEDMLAHYNKKPLNKVIKTISGYWNKLMEKITAENLHELIATSPNELVRMAMVISITRHPLVRGRLDLFNPMTQYTEEVKGVTIVLRPENPEIDKKALFNSWLDNQEICAKYLLENHIYLMSGRERKKLTGSRKIYKHLSNDNIQLRLAA